MNLYSILERAARLLPENTAVRCGGSGFTYRELAIRTAHLAAALREEGVRPGDRAAILHPNCHWFLEAYFAAAALDAVLVPLNVRLSSRELAAVLDHCGASVLLAGPTLARTAQEAAAMTSQAARGAPLRILATAGDAGCGEDLERRVAARMKEEAAPATRTWRTSTTRAAPPARPKA